MERTPGEIARALEVVLLSVKMDKKTVSILRSHLAHQHKKIDAEGLSGEEN